MVAERGITTLYRPNEVDPYRVDHLYLGSLAAMTNFI